MFKNTHAFLFVLQQEHLGTSQEISTSLPQSGQKLPVLNGVSFL
jgi:hypothetical protein